MEFHRSHNAETSSGQPEWQDLAELLEHSVKILESPYLRNKATSSHTVCDFFVPALTKPKIKLQQNHIRPLANLLLNETSSLLCKGDSIILLSTIYYPQFPTYNQMLSDI